MIELLSPSNKNLGDDRNKYLGKREQIQASTAHLVEIDLLRGGARLPTVEPLPSGDYYAYVSRGDRRPTVEVYHWWLRDRLLDVPVPSIYGPTADERW